MENEMQQTTLFEPWDNEKQEKLDKVVDELKSKYGYNFSSSLSTTNFKASINFAPYNSKAKRSSI